MLERRCPARSTRGWRRSSWRGSGRFSGKPHDRPRGQRDGPGAHQPLPAFRVAAPAAGLPLPAELLGVQRRRDRAPWPAARPPHGRLAPAALQPAVAGRRRSRALMDKRTILFVVLSAAFLVVWWI